MLDLAHAVRRLAREPRFTFAAAGTLAVAVAACALVLAFGWATLIQPTARFADSERIVDVQATRGEGSRHGIHPADFLAWREAQRSFEAFGAYVPIGEVDLTDRPGGGEPVRLRVHRPSRWRRPPLATRTPRRSPASTRGCGASSQGCRGRWPRRLPTASPVRAGV